MNIIRLRSNNLTYFYDFDKQIIYVMYFSEEQISRKLFKTKMLIITIRFFILCFI